ncbi:MAG: histidine kinase [Lachnospiraceae bacterium]|nr:histidine kinase [Lachnospiraceae bacterium]
MEKNIYKKQNIIRLAVFFLELILLLVSVNIIHIYDIEKLSSEQTINVSFDLFAMIVLIIVYVSCVYGKRNRSSDSFILLLMSVYLCVFCELGSWMVDSVANARVYNYLFNIGSACMMIISSWLFFFFTCKSLGIDLNDIKAIRTSITGVAIIGIIAEIMNIVFGYYYYIDKQGIYARSNIGSFLSYLTYVYILGITGILIIRMQMPAKKKSIYMSYILVPFVISAWYTLTGLPPTFFVATFISVILIYANIYVDLGRENVEYELENAHKETELALQRNKQTLSQIRPHFIFNALGSIEELCVVDAKKAESAVHYFAKYLRANMDALGETDMVPFETELDHIHNYIWLEKMRFDDELDYIEDIEFDDFLVPMLSIQPLVENAVKHGMMGKEEGTLHVKIRTYQKDNNYVIEVNDDGCGFDTNMQKDDGRSHIGMSYAKTSIENRLGGTLSIDSKIGEGTTVSIVIPCN